MRVLNIDVADALVERWIAWFSPALQPFLADADLAASVGEHAGDVSLSLGVSHFSSGSARRLPDPPRSGRVAYAVQFVFEVRSAGLSRCTVEAKPFEATCRGRRSTGPGTDLLRYGTEGCAVRR